MLAAQAPIRSPSNILWERATKTSLRSGSWPPNCPAGVTIKDGAGNKANMGPARFIRFAGLAVDPPIVSDKPDGSHAIAYSEVTGL